MPKLVKRAANYAVEYYDQKKGFTTRASLGTDDPGLADKLFAQWCLKNYSEDRAPLNTVYVEGLMAQFYTQQAINFPSKYVYKSALAYCSEYLKDVTLAEFKKKRQEEFVEELRDEGLADGTIGRMLGAIGRAVQRAYEYGEIAEKPYILSLSTRNPRQRLLTDAEAKSLLDSAETELQKRFLILAFLTAARPQAIIELDKSQFDMDRKLLDLNPKGRKQNPKKYRPTIPMCNALVDFAKEWGDGPIFRWSKQTKSGIRTGELASSRSLVEDLSFPEGATAYTIRHTVATELRSQGVPEFDLSGFLGHKPPGVNQVSLDYAKYRPDFMRKASEAVDIYWKRVNETKTTDSIGDAGSDGEAAERFSNAD